MSPLLLFLFLCCSTINGKHFSGGTINWQPVYPGNNLSVVPITITQSYSWNYPTITCDTDVPISTSGRSGENTNLTCVADCSTDGGYFLEPVNILTDCQTVSALLGLMKSERSVSINLTVGAHFYLAYIGAAWIALNNPPQNNLYWSIVSSINLRMRSDGFINTPPVTSVVSPQYAVVNQTTQITIPVSDANVGDDVRCRWSVYTPASSNRSAIDECGGICYPGSVPNDTTLSGCTITFTGRVSNIWYAVSFQIEDFINSTSLTPMSSVPVQFLIYVMNQTKCGLAPVILSISRCLDVQVGVSISFNISAMTLCNPNISDIDSIIMSDAVSGMNLSDAVDSLTNASVSYSTFTWKPVASQVGSRQLCLVAYTDEKLQSQQYCVNFNVIMSSALCTTTTTTTTTTSSRTTSTTTTTTTSSTTSTTKTSTTTTSASTTSATKTSSSTTSSSTTSTTTTLSRTTSTTTTSSRTTSSSTTSSSTTSSSTTSSSTTSSRTTSSSTTSSSTTSSSTTSSSTTSSRTTSSSTTSSSTTSSSTTSSSTTSSSTTSSSTTSSSTTSTTTTTTTTLTDTTSTASTDTTSTDTISITTTTVDTTTTETTIIAGQPADWPWIIALLVLGLLLVLCCTCCLLCRWCCGHSARHRRKIHREEEFQRNSILPNDPTTMA